ncbi:stage III sporulation protein AG [Gracilibacillus boraciitolerans JCM 21714]|uniref:Stage III sporulation protein AG n=1 Tax=Gracilibacillus boraciitolerans JCM 21714 TaxID=1298598 RepID=W4VEK5_9BACI|nr:stage III sporulation protein AG [Gracilibacillus boraciitolerans]GAE91243.1 stage III sporulation protein AG [Gracilibacillus boraciitolerans JCM 21714]
MPEWMDKIMSSLKVRDKKPSKLQYIALLILLAVFILMVSNLFGEKESDNQLTNPPVLMEASEDENEQETWKQSEGTTASSKIADVEAVYEKDLILLLEKITGVADVEVMVNLDATNEQVYQKNLVIGSQITNETDQSGGNRKIDDETREQTVVIIRQGEEEVPLLVQTKKPEVRGGVLIVAKGVDNLEVKKWVMDAVSKVLDVPAHRISVMPKNT